MVVYDSELDQPIILTSLTSQLFANRKKISIINITPNVNGMKIRRLRSPNDSLPSLFLS